eukprot:8911916-Ditylum_brightwellii.AAC.1
MIATDGSVADKKGYFAAVLFTTERTIQYQGLCDGAKALMTSYRNRTVRHPVCFVSYTGIYRVL